MAVSNYHFLQAFPVGEVALEKAHGIFVKLGADGRIIRTQADTDPVLGPVIIPLGEGSFDATSALANDKNAAGVCTEHGVKTPAVVSGAIAVGDTVKLDTDGKIATSGGTGPYVGVALEAATVADQVITILYMGLVSRA